MNRIALILISSLILTPRYLENRRICTLNVLNIEDSVVTISSQFTEYSSLENIIVKLHLTEIPITKAIDGKSFYFEIEKSQIETSKNLSIFYGQQELKFSIHFPYHSNIVVNPIFITYTRLKLNLTSLDGKSKIINNLEYYWDLTEFNRDLNYKSFNYLYPNQLGYLKFYYQNKDKFLVSDSVELILEVPELSFKYLEYDNEKLGYSFPIITYYINQKISFALKDNYYLTSDGEQMSYDPIDSNTRVSKIVFPTNMNLKDVPIKICFNNVKEIGIDFTLYFYLEADMKLFGSCKESNFCFGSETIGDDEYYEYYQSSSL